MIREFIDQYRIYRRFYGIVRAARIAAVFTFRGLPF